MTKYAQFLNTDRYGEESKSRSKVREEKKEKNTINQKNNVKKCGSFSFSRECNIYILI